MLTKRNWAEFPFSPKRIPVYYGWVMVFGSVLAVVASVPGQTFGVGVFTESLMEAWDVSRTQISLAYMIGTITSGFILPYAGTLLDRFGARVMVTVSAIGLGFSMMALGWMDAGVHAILPASIFVALPMLSFTFLLVRFWGQGCLALVARVVVGRWFVRHRGIATSLASAMGSFSFSVAPNILNHIVLDLGWRQAAVAIGGVLLFGISSIGALIYRDSPEACGMQVDGDAEAAVPKEVHPDTPHNEIFRDFTRTEALRTLIFWVFTLTLATNGMIVTAFAFHLEDIATSAGISSAQAFRVFIPMSLFSVTTTLLAGWLSDRINLKILLTVQLTAIFLGTTGTYFFAETFGWWMTVAGFGIAGGLFSTLVTVAWPHYFGRAHLGAISGVNMSVMVMSSALGPILFSVFKGQTGSYREVELLCLVIPVLILLAAIPARDPQAVARRAGSTS